jgi:hypothetical protein
VGDPRQLSDSVRHALYEVDPALPVSEIVPLATELNGDLGTEKLLARLAGIYASLTLLLVAIGFYGVMSSRTARRKSEFGIRLALGATRRHIQMLIVRPRASSPPVSCPAQFYRFSRYAQPVTSCMGLSAQIRSQSSQQVSCSRLPVLSPLSSPLAVRRLPIRWKRSAVNNRRMSQRGLARPMSY